MGSDQALAEEWGRGSGGRGHLPPCPSPRGEQRGQPCPCRLWGEVSMESVFSDNVLPLCRIHLALSFI